MASKNFEYLTVGDPKGFRSLSENSEVEYLENDMR